MTGDLRPKDSPGLPDKVEVVFVEYSSQLSLRKDGEAEEGKDAGGDATDVTWTLDAVDSLVPLCQVDSFELRVVVSLGERSSEDLVTCSRVSSFDPGKEPLYLLLVMVPLSMSPELLKSFSSIM